MNTPLEPDEYERKWKAMAKRAVRRHAPQVPEDRLADLADELFKKSEDMIGDLSYGDLSRWSYVWDSP